ncbi:RNA polymerase sigma factor [Kribbella sp. DT2]|uniref:RNA polymerase sigma factor n=1 Tax=Kribbella sp. DT2 TaxID=3393427 RepID=UPI003CE78512
MSPDERPDEAGPGTRGDATPDGELDAAIRAGAPKALATLVRRYGVFDQCEDAVQEALLAAAAQWRENGVPEQPVGWLISVATRRLMDGWRRDNARRQREVTDFLRTPVDPDPAEDTDDTLRLLILCCHPSLTPASQIALTLRSVGGLTTTEVAAALLVPEATVAQRISRAKRLIKDAGARFELPTDDQYDKRLRAVLQVLYLIFNEGHTASSGDTLQRLDLAVEALRITRMLHQSVEPHAQRHRAGANPTQLPAVAGPAQHFPAGASPAQHLPAGASPAQHLPAKADPTQHLPTKAGPAPHPAAPTGEVSGLLALMILTHARRAARTGPGGDLVPADRQDRTRWHHEEITEGTRLIETTLQSGRVGPYQLEAAIAAVHSEADSVESTDWEQIAGLYRILAEIDPGPMVRLGQAVAVAMTDGPDAGIAIVDALADDRHLGDHHRRLSVLAHLHELAGRYDAARALYEAALARTRNTAEQNYLRDRLTH